MRSRKACRGVGLLTVVFFLLSAAPLFAQFALEVTWPPEMTTCEPENGFPARSSAALPLEVNPDFGLHIYRDRIKASFSKQQGVVFKELVVPPGVRMNDPADPDKEVMVLEDDFQVMLRFQVDAAAGEPVEIEGSLLVQGCTDDICYPPVEMPFAWSGVAAPVPEGVETSGSGGEAAVEADVTSSPTPMSAAAAGKPSSEEPGEDGEPTETGEILLMILGAFGTGILLSLTPCVLPMIPITSAIILRFSRPGIGSALLSSCIYVLGLSLTYALAGVGVAFLGGAVRSVFNAPWFLGIIAGIFTVLALSMFGLFDIALPSGLAGKLQQRSSQSGKNRIGLLFMGMISGLIVGPCVTAPIAYLFVIIAKVGSPMIGFWTMFSLAWGMGLLIIAAGTFTGLVPKAGAWTEWFKKFFGFVMLWGALYFLRSILGFEIYELASAALLLVASVFLGGFDHLPVDAHWGLRLRKLVGVVAMTMALFLGFDYFLSQRDLGSPAAPATAVEPVTFLSGGRAELDRAGAEGQPAVLYFTAGWCDICKTLKKKTLFQPVVTEALEGMVSLTVDFDGEPGLVEDFSVVGPPTLIFIDANGVEREMLRVSGFLSDLELADRIGQLKSN